MEKPKRTYSNAGAQTQLAYRELMRYGSGTDDDFLPVKTVSLILGINRNKVVQIPVDRILRDKRAYYRKGDLRAWMKADAEQPESLLAKLREEQAKAVEKIRKQPSRRYITAELSQDEAKLAKAQTRANRGLPPSKDELTRGWGTAGRVQKDNPPILPPRKTTLEEHALELQSINFVRSLLNSK